MDGTIRQSVTDGQHNYIPCSAVSQHNAAVTNDFLNRQLGAAAAKAKRYGAAQYGRFHKSQN